MGDVPDFVDEDEADVWEGGGTAYKIEKVVGNGAFGIVWKARATDTGEVVAIKKVLLDRRYQNRELQMMKVMDHECVVRLKHFYEKPGRKKDETFLQIVMEYLPDTLRSVTLRYQKKRKRFPIEHIKVYLFQMLKAMEYIHSRRICHRDIKPDNLLVDPTTLRLKLCDFGCSKVLVKGQPNISYICSRYYRAPELLFGATEYSCALDLWSIGTILAELLLGHLPFQGQDSTQQHLVEIMKLLGTPTNHDLQAMGASCTADDLPKLKPFPWDRVFPAGTPADAIDLVSRLLCYNPETRLNAQQALAHPFLEGVSMAGTEADAAEGASPMRGARGAQELVAQTSAFIEDLSARDSAFAASFIPSLESNLLSGIKAAGVPDGVYAAVVASVRAELKSAAAALERRRGENAELAYRMQQKVVTVAQESGAVAASTQPSGGGSSEMEVDGQSKAAERERLAAAVASLTKQLEESKGLQAKAAEALKSAQAKAEQLEAERAMSAVAINDGARVASVAVSVQTDDELTTEPRDASAKDQAGFGRRAPGRSYMSGFFSNNGIVPSPLLKRPSAVTTPMNRGGAQGEQRDSSPALETQVIMDGSQNLGQVRPAGAMSPMSSGTSPRTGAKWGLGRSAPAVPPSGGNSETSQPISEELMPENRRSFRRSLNEER